jgi:hypothetical protein
VLTVEHELRTTDREDVLLWVVAVEVIAGMALVDLNFGHIAQLNCQFRINKYY